MKLPPGWSQLVRRNGSEIDPQVWHLCRDICLLEFVNARGWEQRR